MPSKTVAVIGVGFFMNKKRITKIEIQKKNPERLNVFLDGEFAFGISRFTAVWLKPGDDLDEEKIRSLLSDDEKERALQAALHFIGYKTRTVREVEKKLNTLEFSQTVIDQVINDLVEKKYLDDSDYARQWVQMRSISKPRSQRMIAYELAHRGIEKDDIDSALSEAPNDECQALALGTKYAQRYKNLPEPEFRKKLIGLLSRRAFSFLVINSCLDILINMKNQQAELKE